MNYHPGIRKPPAVLDFLPGPRLDEAIEWAEHRPDGAAFIEHLRAVQDGRIALTVVFSRRVAWTPRSLKSRLPTIVLLSDDAGDSRDPAEWRCLLSVLAWSRSVIVHGTGAQSWHYREAVKAAEATGRCLFVETNSAHAPAWGAAVEMRQIPGLVFVPFPGGVHPVTDGGAA